MHTKYRSLFLATLLTLPALAQALPEDQQQPIHISADHASMNERTGITVYTGNVEIVQGTMVIRGARVELHRNDEGVQRIISTGKPAQFQQQPKHDQPLTKAYGERMDYRVNKQEVTITEAARVDQGRDTFTGERIVYNMKQAVVNAYGSEKDSGQRVQMVIQPKTEGN